MRRISCLISLIVFCAVSLMAYESPITEPGAGSPVSMYSTAGSGPHKDPVNNTGGETTYNPEDWTNEGGGSGTDAGNQDTLHYPIGAPWILLGFAAVYGFSVAIRRRKE